VSECKGDFSDYKNHQHRGVQGKSYVVWRNRDFNTPFTAKMLLSSLNWDGFEKSK